eukprot:jgi/Mesen1/8613/ME000050S08024
MVEGKLHQVAPSVSCHAWNADFSLVAVCPNNLEVHIYSVGPSEGDPWEKLHVLKKHDQLVAGIDWAAHSDRIVTCSHDRNAYVWQWDGRAWQAALVILRLNRAALSVSWSPRENKFAVGSGARSVMLATTSTDGKCRVFSAFLKGVDARGDTKSAFGEAKFGEQLLQLDLACGWAFGVKWSPSGSRLAFVGHDSTIHFVNDVGPALTPHSLALRGLPLRDVLFLSETHVVAGGYDCNPQLFAMDTDGNWVLVQALDDGKSAPQATSAPSVTSPNRQSSQFSEAMGMFDGQQAKQAGGTGVGLSGPTTLHHNVITSIRPMVARGEGNIRRFSTAGVDGKIVLWDIGSLQISTAMSAMRL